MPATQSQTARLRAIAAGVTSTSRGATAVMPVLEVIKPSVPGVDVDPAQLLTTEQMKMFVAQGFIALKVSTLPEEFHSTFHQTCEALHRAKGEDGPGGEVLAEALDAIVQSRITRGALTSILGPGFVGGTPRGGAPGGSSDSDQGYHKDNSSNCAVRDITTPRQISMFYYPGPVKAEDGATCFLPGTQYLALDREGLGQGEERLDPFMMPGKTPEQWHNAIGGFTDSHPNGYAETDQRKETGLMLLGKFTCNPHPQSSPRSSPHR